MPLEDLLALQGKCKTDPESYRDDFALRLRHYRTLHAIFALSPAGEHKEFADLVNFLAQVRPGRRRWARPGRGGGWAHASPSPPPDRRPAARCTPPTKPS